MKKSLSAEGGTYVPNSIGSDAFRFLSPSSPGTLKFTLTVTDKGTNIPASDTMSVIVR